MEVDISQQYFTHGQKGSLFITDRYIIADIHPAKQKPEVEKHSVSKRQVFDVDG